VNAPIPAGDYFLSVQASEVHYCDPEETLEDPQEYTSFEVAIFDKNKEWVNPREALAQFAWAERFRDAGKIDQRQDDGWDFGVRSVAGWVGVKEVEQIRSDLRSLSKNAKDSRFGSPEKKAPLPAASLPATGTGGGSLSWA
jgi:hypothetical protein